MLENGQKQSIQLMLCMVKSRDVRNRSIQNRGKSVRQESEQSSADLSKVVVKDDVDEQMNVDDLLSP